MDTLQFYPTPPRLAMLAYDTFKSKHITRLLEPSAGRADLLEPILEKMSRWHDTLPVDCIEIDLNNQAVLRDKKLNVIDGDFDSFEHMGTHYSHILMNPPFNKGAEHVLKAWDILFKGELVAIINAETYRNPFSKARKQLKAIIDASGDISFHKEMFTDPDTQRSTSVEIAIVYLEKKGSAYHDLFAGLKDDKFDAGNTKATNTSIGKEVAIKQSQIENTLIQFKVAVDKMRSAVIAKYEAGYYAGLVGVDLQPKKEKAEQSAGYDDTSYSRKGLEGSIGEEINKRYLTIKEAAWRSVLNATEFQDHLSSAAYKRLLASFEDVIKLEFTAVNIYGLLAGLVQGKGDMQLEMVQDCFDLITKYHTGNCSFYPGWKSNDKHRTAAFRVKPTRFILTADFTFSSLMWADRQMLADFDRVFALLDGKRECEFGLVSLFNKHYSDLLSGKRLASDYFEIRAYARAGTIHFFTTRPDLIDRLNRLVGKHRQWLPEQDDHASDAFWAAYEDSEKISKGFEMIINETPGWNPAHDIYRDADKHLHRAMDKVGITMPASGYMQIDNAA